MAFGILRTIDRSSRRPSRSPRWVSQVVVPGFEVDVGDQRGTAASIPLLNDLEQQRQGLGSLLSFDTVEAEAVDNQQIEATEVTNALGSRAVGQ